MLLRKLSNKKRKLLKRLPLIKLLLKKKLRLKNKLV